MLDVSCDGEFVATADGPLPPAPSPRSAGRGALRALRSVRAPSKPPPSLHRTIPPRSHVAGSQRHGISPACRAPPSLNRSISRTLDLSASRPLGAFPKHTAASACVTLLLRSGGRAGGARRVRSAPDPLLTRSPPVVHRRSERPRPRSRPTRPADSPGCEPDALFPRHPHVQHRRKNHDRAHAREPSEPVQVASWLGDTALAESPDGDAIWTYADRPRRLSVTPSRW